MPHFCLLVHACARAVVSTASSVAFSVPTQDESGRMMAASRSLQSRIVALVWSVSPERALWASLPVIFACALMAGCMAPAEQKLGYAGEFCTGGDGDCREPLVCENSVCVYPSYEPWRCEVMCQRLAYCETSEDDCLGECRNTVEGWSDEALTSFGRCIVEDLSCEEARTVDAPQTCYLRIPMDPAREERCEDFLVAARGCGVAEEGLEGLRQQCLYLARTGAEESFGRTEACVERLADPVCQEIVDCLTGVFALDPPLVIATPVPAPEEQAPAP